MKAKKKGEIFFVKETPDDYQFDYDNARFLSKKEADELLKPPTGKKRKTRDSKNAS